MRSSRWRKTESIRRFLAEKKKLPVTLGAQVRPGGEVVGRGEKGQSGDLLPPNMDIDSFIAWSFLGVELKQELQGMSWSGTRKNGYNSINLTLMGCVCGIHVRTYVRTKRTDRQTDRSMSE